MSCRGAGVKRFLDIFHSAFGRSLMNILSVRKEYRLPHILQHAAVGSACVYREVRRVLVPDFQCESVYVWNINDLFTPLIALPRGAE